jgi:hypothetical protein
LFRNSGEVWETAGSKNFEQRAKESAIELLRVYQSKPLPSDGKRELDGFVSSSMKSLVGEEMRRTLGEDFRGRSISDRYPIKDARRRLRVIEIRA